MSQSSSRKMSPTLKMTLVVVPFVVIIAGWTFWQQLRQADTRQAGVQLPPYGVVTVQLTTDPFPAVATGTVQMTLRLQAPGGRAALVDRVTYTYGSEDGDEEFHGQAQLVAMDTFQGPLRFTGVGDWWVTVRLEYRGAAGEARFTVPVKPAL
jgi:hypothetical protein